MAKEHVNSHPYVGMWVTSDGYIRHELLPNGRYDEARGDIESAYQGSYTVKGNHIEYQDDTALQPMVILSMECCTMQVWFYIGKNLVKGERSDVWTKWKSCCYYRGK